MALRSVSATRFGISQITLFLLIISFVAIGSGVSKVNAFTVLSFSQTKRYVSKSLRMLPPPEDCESEEECEIDWGDDEDETEDEVQSGESDENGVENFLSPEKIAEMIEVSFVNACMQLASGHIDVLKLFIVASKAGYETGISIPDLLAKLAECPVQSANRPLLKEEDELRALWVQLVYLTLGTVRHSSDDLDCINTVDESTRNKYDKLMMGVVQCIEKDNAEGKQSKINTLSDISEKLGNNDLDFSDLEAFAKNDPVQNAIITQSIKLIGLTMTVLEEEKFCFESGGQGTPPRPSIPGAYSA